MILGHQWSIAPKMAMIGAAPMTVRKCATTSIVSETGTSTTTLPRNNPLSPPLAKVTMNACANSMGSVS